MTRLIVVLGMVLALLVLSPARVAACSCMETTLSDAVRSAELAFVGNLVESNAPAPGAPVVEEQRATFTWRVERAGETIEGDLVSVVGWPNSGANCGVSFGANERWLVLTYLTDGQLETNSCLPNQRLDGATPELEAQVAEMLPVVVEGEAAPTGAEALPVPVLVGGAGVLLIALIGFVAFRRDRPT